MEERSGDSLPNASGEIHPTEGCFGASSAARSIAIDGN
jgi:hypothetical protein